jgi:hypothetical protein
MELPLRRDQKRTTIIRDQSFGTLILTWRATTLDVVSNVSNEANEVTFDPQVAKLANGAKLTPDSRGGDAKGIWQDLADSSGFAGHVFNLRPVELTYQAGGSYGGPEPGICERVNEKWAIGKGRCEFR